MYQPAQSEDLFQKIFETSNDAIMLLDDKGFFDCNQSTLKTFGYQTKEEFCQKTPGQISPPFQPDGQDSTIKANQQIALAKNQGKNFFEWIHRRSNGDDFFAEVLLTPLQVGDKTVFQATVRDISSRKQKETELTKINQTMIDRELKMIELKAKIKELETK